MENLNGGFVVTVKEGGGDVRGTAKSSSELLTEASMSMSLAILETLGPSRKFSFILPRHCIWF